MPKISYADLQGQIDKYRYGKIQMGLDFGHSEIDKYLKFKRGNFNVIIGHNNVGKTTTIIFLMVMQSVKNQIKWLIYSSENSPESIGIKIIQFYLGKFITRIEEDEMQKAMNFMMQFFIILDADKQICTFNQLLEEATDIHKEEGIDGFLVDPYNSLAKDREMFKQLGGHEYDYEVASAFRTWCKQQQVSLWLNTHAVTNALRNKHSGTHEYAGLTQPPRIGDVEGGAKWGNRSDSVWCIHRYLHHSDHWMYTHIHNYKEKETSTGGMVTPLDEPIRLRMLPNQVGFEMFGTPLLPQAVKKQESIPYEDLPF